MFFAKQDKRSFQRMALDTAIEITKGSMVTPGICKDLSSTGMSITYTDASLKEGDEVHIRLDTADHRLPPLDVEARLLRVEKNEQGFMAAVQFISMK